MSDEMRDTTRKPPFSFWTGFMQGFSAGCYNGEPVMPPRYHGGDGIKGDWKNVGRDIRKAMRKFDERRSA